MSPPEWHMKLAFEMLELADRSLALKKYPVVVTAVLRAFEEIMEAHAAKDSGIHFHNDFPDVGPQKRISWVKANRPELFDSWEKILQCIDPKFQDDAKMQQMVNILKSVLTPIKTES